MFKKPVNNFLSTEIFFPKCKPVIPMTTRYVYINGVDEYKGTVFISGRTYTNLEGKKANINYVNNEVGREIKHF